MHHTFNTASDQIQDYNILFNSIDLFLAHWKSQNFQCHKHNYSFSLSYIERQTIVLE